MPAGTVTFAGTSAIFGMSELSLISAPPGGAGVVSVIVPVEGLPPTTTSGVNVRLAGTGGGAPQTFGVPPPPQNSGVAQTPQASHAPAPSGIAPQFLVQLGAGDRRPRGMIRMARLVAVC